MSGWNRFLLKSSFAVSHCLSSFPKKIVNNIFLQEGFFVGKKNRLEKTALVALEILCTLDFNDKRAWHFDINENCMLVQYPHVKVSGLYI